MISALKFDVAFESGEACFADIGVYAGWVAHANSFASRQSASERSDGRTLVFAGECQSSPELSTLFCESADLDAGRLAALNGQFSGLFVDPMRRRAVLFNDRYASERIYVFRDGDNTYFSSEAKALLRIAASTRAFDAQGVADFLNYGSVLGGRTLFQGIRCLPGASMWIFQQGNACAQDFYFRPAEWETQQELGDAEYGRQFVDIFRSALPQYLDAQSRVGISVTGGLDSRMIMACLGASGLDPICYTYAGLQGEPIDARIGSAVAQRCHLEHRTLRLGPSFLNEFGGLVDRTVFVTDGCAGALSAHEIYFTSLAKQLSPVRLTGNYGSEILRSVSTFKTLGIDPALFDTALGLKLSESVARVREGQVHPVTHAAFREVPWHLFGTLAAARSQVVVRTPFLDNEVVRLAYQASARARQTPEPALRLIQAANPSLAELPTDRCVALNGAPSNPFLRFGSEVAFKLDYWHKEGLPHWLSPIDPLLGYLSHLGQLGLHKFLPYRVWFKRELAGYLTEVISDDRTRRMPFWNPRFLDVVVSDHVKGRCNHLRELNAILTLEAVQRMLINDNADAQSLHSEA